jgi:hypothetical protein
MDGIAAGPVTVEKGCFICGAGDGNRNRMTSLEELFP